MDESAVLEIGRDAVVVMLKISAPIMLISLIVGLIMGDTLSPLALVSVGLQLRFDHLRGTDHR